MDKKQDGYDVRWGWKTGAEGRMAQLKGRRKVIKGRRGDGGGGARR